MLKRLLSYPLFLIVLASSVPAQAQDDDAHKPLRIDTKVMEVLATRSPEAVRA